MEKTAVEWLIDEIYGQGILDGVEQYCHDTLKQLYKKATEIHKQECINFYIKGCEDTYGMDEGTDDKKDAEQYYNQTFKKD